MGIPAILYAVTILLSAFLLFQIELIMGKFVLPRSGGGPSVWSTSLLVFQILLLAGYGYVTFICRRLAAKTQAIIHFCLLVGSGLMIAVSAAWLHSPIFPRGEPRSTDNPVGQIAWLLVTAVGVQCVVLSATSPLLQDWFSRQHRSSPYRLYALSNLGSMLGLLSYPFLVEPALRLSTQAWAWAAGYALFLLLAGMCAFFYMRHWTLPPEAQSRKPARSKKAGKSAEAQPRILWLGLAACASAMLLATTNLICQQVAPVPLLWVLPLGLYLLSFIICFDHDRWYRREIFQPLYVVLALLALKMLPSYASISIAWLVVLYCAALLAVCMVCHGELARLKPAPEHLTSFYWMVSLGGAVGSAFVVMVAPQIFNRFWEFQIALLGCGILLATTLVRDRSSWIYNIRYGRAVLAVGVAGMAIGSYIFTDELLTWEGQGDDAVILRTRNFFGVKTVANLRGRVVLAHGHTMHGAQFIDPARRSEPTLYYGRKTGIGLLLDQYPRNSGDSQLRVGVVGMGAGTLAAYGRAGDYLRFYEIDPAVANLSLGASPLFTFVQSSAMHVDLVLGDARMKMQEEVSRGDLQRFDVLVVDAFSGDSVPVHLLTREAMNTYLRQLRGPQSVIAFHLTTSALNLRPVAEGLARAYNLASVEIDTPKPRGPIWVLIAKDPSIFRLPALAAAAHPVEVKRSIPVWTDDYSSLYPLLQW